MSGSLLAFPTALCLLAAIAGGCATRGSPPPPEAARVDAIATAFVDAYYQQFPEEAYEVGYPNAPLDRFGDRGAAAAARFDRRIDAWLDELRAIDPTALRGTAAGIAYAFARARLEALAARRVCRMDAWNVSPTWTGWQSQLAATLAAQPVANAQHRAAALARIADLDRYLETEIELLRGGIAGGYLAPAVNVRAVLRQIDALLATAPEESPFYDPAGRADDPDFRHAYRRILTDEVYPALRAYRRFLDAEYTGRDAVGVAANPDGEACYRASVLYHSSLDLEPEAIHRTGLREMARIQAEMRTIARDSFATEDLAGLLERLRTAPEFTFASEQEMLDYVTAAVRRGEAAAPRWFGRVPRAELVIKPSPAFEQDSGGGFYAAGSADGSRPATYQVGTYNPTAISKAGQESTAFHESYPGHHLQGIVALYNESLHPIQRFMYVSGMAEGWGLYAERLADEMGLYSSELARLGMLSNEAFRAARLVVDPGLHVLGWTREQAIDYLLAHTAEGRPAIESEVDRYLAVPGQATSYLLGSLEILRLRRLAEQRLGERFDIKAFHDRVLADGGVTLPMLKAAIEAWIAEAGD